MKRLQSLAMVDRPYKVYASGQGRMESHQFQVVDRLEKEDVSGQR